MTHGGAVRFHCPGIWILPGRPCLLMCSRVYEYSFLTYTKFKLCWTLHSITVV